MRTTPVQTQLIQDYGGMSTGFGLESLAPSGAGGGVMENTVLNTILNLDSSTIKDKVSVKTSELSSPLKMVFILLPTYCM